MAKCLSTNNANLQEGGFRMKARTFVQFTMDLTLVLILLTACDGSVESNFSVNNDGFDFQASEPKFSAEETFTRELPVVNHMRIRLEGVRGGIEIEGQNDANSVTVIAQKWVGSDSLADAEMHLDELEILITDQIDEILIQTLQPEDTQGRSYIVDYHIILPSDMETEVTLMNGDIGVQDVQNSVIVDAVNGNVFLLNVFADATVSLANGNIHSTMALPLDGEIRMSTDNGNIDLGIPTSTSAVFAASVNNGLISESNLEFDAAVQTSHSLTGTLGNGEGVIDLGTINGSISVVGLN
jgi:hypothetical protein